MSDLNAPPVVSSSDQCLSTNESQFINRLFYNESEEKDLPVVSIIFTIFSGSSYDSLYSRAKQVCPEGTTVAVYSVDLNKIDIFYDYLTDQSKKSLIFDHIREIMNIEPECVLFNFECCSGCQSKQKNTTKNFCGSNYSSSILSKIKNFGFSSSNSENKCMNDNGYGFLKEESVLKLIQLCISKGYYIMFGDFSVKAILNSWDSSILGENPFEQIGECSNSIKLHFDSKTLMESESNQMRIVGELCRDGNATIHCMSSTIVFTLKKKANLKTSKYEGRILTKAESSGFEVSDKSDLIDEKYTIGHASLKYNSGSIIFFSAGHWIELNDINVNINDLKECLKKNVGENNVYYQDIISYEKKSEIEKETSTKKNTFSSYGMNEESESNFYYGSVPSNSYNQESLFKSSNKNAKAFNIASNFIQQTSNCNYSVKNQMNVKKK